MSRIPLILVVIACCCAPSFASWALLPLDELVQDCDIIVVGTLTDVTEHSLNGTDFGQGTILIDEVVWGAASAEESLVLKWQTNRESSVRVSTDKPGRKAIWLPTVEDGGVVCANYLGDRGSLRSDRSRTDPQKARVSSCREASLWSE
jgi:hypothetical protein